MLGELEALPGAASLTIHAQVSWALLMIMASSDTAVFTLGEMLGLTSDVQRENGRWRRVAVGKSATGFVRYEVKGPSHAGPLPDVDPERIGRLPTAPVTLTAAQVLEVARSLGACVLDTATGERLSLLASLGLDLGSAEIRGALFELHLRGGLQLAQLRDPSAVRSTLEARGLPGRLVEESTLRDGEMLFHAVVIP
jgi:hypothetical protein